MKKILGLFIAFTTTGAGYAQNTLEIKDTGNISRERWRDSTFRMAKSNVPTGFLWDYSMFGFEPAKYNGQANNDDTIKSAGRIFELHNILWHSKVNSNAIITPTDTLFKKAYMDHFNADVVPLTFIYQKFNRIRQTALSENLLYIASDSVGILDVAGRTKSPYDTHEIFAFAPFEIKITRFNSIMFTLPAELFYIKGLNNVEVDFGDGAGFRSLSKGSSINIYYSSEGLKYLTARLTISGGVRIAKAMIDYKRPSTFTKPAHSLIFQAAPVYNSDNQYLGGTQLTTMSTVLPSCEGSSLIERFKCSLNPAARVEVDNGCDGTFDKPIIIVEGFDPNDELTIDELRDRFSRNNFVLTMRNYGYDFVYVDFTRNGTYIENNAKVLEAVINWVNQNKTGTNRSSIIGFSMGGLITRWCLKDMEDRGLAHQVENYFSYDAPHQCANIPLGMQYVFKELVRDLPYLRWNNDLQKLDDAFRSPAARQMLVTYGSYNNSTLNWFPNLQTLDPLRSTFAQRLQTKGYPQTRNFGIAFGRGDNAAGTKDAGNGRQFTPANPFTTSKEIYWSALAFFLVNAEALANAVPENNTKATIAYYSFFGITFRKIFGLQIAPQVKLRVRRFDYRGQFSYDETQGSFEQTQTQFAIQWRRGLAAPPTTYLHDGHNFNSTVGALDFQNQNYSAGNSWQSSNMFFNIDNLILNRGQVNGNSLPNPALSPFRAVITGTSDCGAIGGCSAERYVTENNTFTLPPNVNRWNHFHNTDMTVQTALFIERNILNANPANCAGANGLCNLNPTINGLETVCTTAAFELLNLPNGVNILWETLNGSLRIADGQGTNRINVNAISGGNETVRATITNACGASRVITRTVRVGGFGSSDYPVSGPSSASCNQQVYYNTNTLPGATSYNWFWPSDWMYISGQGTPNITLQTPSYSQSGGGMVGVRVANACDAGGSPGTLFTQVYCNGGFIVSPNPASDEVTVSQNTTVAAQQKLSIGITEVAIYDQRGNLLKRQKFSKVSKANLNVSSLNTGVYIIEVSNGVTKERQQLSVRKQ